MSNRRHLLAQLKQLAAELGPDADAYRHVAELVLERRDAEVAALPPELQDYARAVQRVFDRRVPHPDAVPTSAA